MQSLSYTHHTKESESITAQVYSAIKDGDFTKAIGLFDSTLGQLNISKSRPILSILAYCCYNNQDYARAAEFYEELVALCPGEEDYHLYYVQSLVKSRSYHDACRVATAALSTSTSPEHSQRLRLLYAQSQMELGLLSSCNKTLSKCNEDDPATIIAMAASCYKEEKIGSALEKYKIAKQMMGDVPMVLYHMALCRCQMGDHDEALEEVNELIESITDIKDKPEGLSETELKESFIVEAMNLKAVIYQDTKQFGAAREVLRELRHLAGIDNQNAITLHNEIMSNMEVDPLGGMERLNQLLTDATFPPETLSNLLLLYIKHGEDAVSLETFEANKLVAKEILPPDLYKYIEAAILSRSSPDDALTMLENLIAKMIPKLKTAKKKLDDAEAESSAARPSTTSIRPMTTARILATSLAEAEQEFNDCLQTFIPILMLQVRLFWDRRKYAKAEQLLLLHSDYCLDNNDWNLNLGHTLFAQQNEKLEESIPHYEHVVNQWAESGELLKAPAVALANLCVSYIMSGQNESAEAIIKAIENEEDGHDTLETEDAKPTYHTCLVNLVIGTLYCEKGNYEFGISRICKSLEPLEKNLCADTWFYCKRCFLALAVKLSKLMIVLDDEVMNDIMDFLSDVETHGESVVIVGNEEMRLIDAIDSDQNGQSVTVSQEAQQLKHLFIKLSQ